MNRQKARASATINVPKKLLDTVIVKLGLADKFLLENGGSSGQSSQSAEDSNGGNVELDANHVLELFMSLFGSSSSNTNLNISNSAAGARSAAATHTAAADPYFGRIYSIDSDGNSLESSSPEHMFTKENRQDSGAAHVHHDAANLFRQATNKSAMSLPSHDGTVSLQRGNSLASTQSKASDTPPQSQHGQAQQQQAQQQERRDRAGTEEVGDMQVEDVGDRKDSYDSTISLDANNREVAVKSKFAPLMLENLSGHANMGAEVPASPGAGAAARLADALQKLRQVDL